MESIAHIRKSDYKIQTVEQHLLEVKNLAESYGERVNVAHVTGLAGMLHDLGKFTEEFSTYIKKAVENPDNPPKRGSVDHSTAGGMFLYELLHKNGSSINEKILAELVGNAIISHHGFLKDFNNPSLDSKYLSRVNKEEKKDVYANYEEFSSYFYSKVMDESSFANYFNKAVAEIGEYVIQSAPVPLRTSLYYLTTFVFSALVDADRTNTRLFEEGNEHSGKNTHVLFELYNTKLEEHLIGLQQSPASRSAINQLRMDMSEECKKFAKNESGIYSLSIPTGGGKTLASLRYALNHALEHGKERIIYVIPYTSIIDQNAKLVKAILDDDTNIVEHHSNVDFGSSNEKEQDDDLDEMLMNKREKIRLATDNWDAPIIFTTMVQYLNAFYAKGNRHTRRLHNLTNAVVIFDEVQKVPSKCLSLFSESQLSQLK
jgi:CRISPR-associated endonuclease/helicase Cas3